LAFALWVVDIALYWVINGFYKKSRFTGEKPLFKNPIFTVMRLSSIE